MKRFILFLPLLAVIALVTSGCWEADKYRHCVCTDKETETKVKVTIYDRKCSDETYSKNRKAGYERWECVTDTTVKKVKSED